MIGKEIPVLGDGGKDPKLEFTLQIQCNPITESWNDAVLSGVPDAIHQYQPATEESDTKDPVDINWTDPRHAIFAEISGDLIES